MSGELCRAVRSLGTRVVNARRGESETIGSW